MEFGEGAFRFEYLSMSTQCTGNLKEQGKALMSRIAVHALDFKLISVYASRSVGKSQCLVCSSAPPLTAVVMCINGCRCAVLRH